MTVSIERVHTEAHLRLLLPLVRAYCDFYGVHPTDEALQSMSETLMSDPDREGVQLLALEDGQAVGFATVFWSWETSVAARVGVLNDLYVGEQARGRGVGAALIAEALVLCRGRQAARLVWQTAPDNLRAQALYDRLHARREQWISYSMDA